MRDPDWHYPNPYIPPREETHAERMERARDEVDWRDQYDD